MSDRDPLVAICVPCLNEADIISDTVAHLKKASEDGRIGYPAVILVVDDGSTDNTAEIARSAGVDYLYVHETNRGLGAATRVGMEVAHYLGCDAFVKFDADQQHDVADIKPALDLLLNNEADVVYASRFAGSINYRMPLLRRLGNKFFTRVSRVLTRWPVTDAQTGLMCFSRRYLTIFEMPSTYNPTQQALFDASRKGMRYAEVPAEFHKRRSGESYIQLKYIPKVFSSLLKLSYYHYGFRAFALFGLTLLAAGLVVAVLGLTNYLLFDGASYLPNGTFVLVTLLLGTLSILLGLQSYAFLGRQPYIRNGSLYLYTVLEKLEAIHTPPEQKDVIKQ